MDLTGKKVLFIAPKHYYLEGKIIDYLHMMGAEVTYYPEVVYNRVYTLIRDKTFSPLNKMLDALYFNKILRNIDKNQYDIFFLIRGGMIDVDFLEKIRNKLPNAYFVMYQWDSVIHNDYKSKIKYFDYSLTFDQVDAQKLHIDYLPLFYLQECENIQNMRDNMIFDISFFGTFHSDRLSVIKKVALECKEKNLKFHYHLYAGKINIFLLLLRRKISFSDIKYFKSYGASLSEIIQQYTISKAVLDIEMTNQIGLTLRTLETLGAGRKLLTTNLNVKDSEVFDKNFIQIIDREKPRINVDFLNSPIKETNLYEQYHISRWLMQIMSKNRDDEELKI